MKPQLRIVELTDCLNGPARAAILSASLDAPKPGPITGGKESTVRVAGWVLARDPTSSIQVIAVVQGVEKQRVKLTVKREDVVIRILKQSSSESTQLNCGFIINLDLNVEVDEDMTIEIQVQINEQVHFWKQISIFHFEEKRAEKILNAWQAYCMDRLQDISTQDEAAIELLDSNLVKGLLFGSPRIIRNFEQAENLTCFTQTELPYFKSFFKNVASTEFCVQLTRAAIDCGQCEIQSPFDAGQATCRESITTPSSINCLRFVTHTGDVFFVLQHVTSADALYFPQRHVVVMLQHITLPLVTATVVYICRNFSRHLDYSRKRLDNHFLGVISSHGRPYHFYYDVAPGMHLLATHGLMTKLPSIVMVQGGDYFSFRKFYDLSCDETVLSLEAIEERSINGGGFYVHIGMPFSLKDSANTREFDQYLMQHFGKLIDTNTKKQLNEAEGCFPLIWFGICGQKRAWIEQIDAGVNIVTELAKTFPGLGIVFDGWTSPLNPTNSDAAETEKDQRVIQKIISKLPRGTKTFSVVGAGSVRKLAFASASDFFIANYSTGSLHVARFAKKPGVAHINTQMNKNEHIHYATHEVSPFDVRDIPDPDNPRADFTSYSIDWQVVYKVLLKLISEVNLVQERLKSADHTSLKSFPLAENSMCALASYGENTTCISGA